MNLELQENSFQSLEFQCICRYYYVFHCPMHIKFLNVVHLGILLILFPRKLNNSGAQINEQRMLILIMLLHNV